MTPIYSNFIRQYSPDLIGGKTPVYFDFLMEHYLRFDRSYESFLF